MLPQTFLQSINRVCHNFIKFGNYRSLHTNKIVKFNSTNLQNHQKQDLRNQKAKIRIIIIELFIAGARDAMYRLTLEGLTQLEKAEWPAKEDKIISCTTKGQSEADCHNFIKILVSDRNKLFACGTYAFSPKCSWRNIEAINHVTRYGFK